MKYKKKPDGFFYNAKLDRIVLHKGYSTSIAWSPQMIADLKRYFPTSTNQECAEIIGVSPRTVVRKARELGLSKDSSWLLNIWNENRMLAHAESKRKSYPGTFKKGNTIGFEYRFSKKAINEQSQS